MGPPQLLICLFGTLQCNVHTIPIELWLPKTYPRDAPFLYIQPSPGIVIRATQNVDPAGRVFHPILGMWRPDTGLVELLRVMTGVLSADPPFYPGTGRPVYAGASPGSIGTPLAAPQSPITQTPDNLPQLRRMLKERLNGRFQALQKELSSESDRILAENTLLSRGETFLAEGLAKILDETRKLEGEIETIRVQKDKLIQLASSDQGEIDYDTLVVPQGPIAKQIIEVVSIDLAIQDLIYIISKVFSEGQMPTLTLTLYLKSIRELAREQFLQKALLSKIRREFPLIKN